MSNIPFLNGLIDNPDLLFGRKDLLDQLLDKANNMTPLQLIGARRFGKTCTINAFATLLKKQPDAIAYPIILDTYSDNIVGTDKAYSYIASSIISQLYIDRLIGDEDIILDYVDTAIKPSERWKKINSQILSSGEDPSEVFESTVENMSSLIGKRLLLIFDEYEHMARKAFEVAGFRTLRRISDKVNSPMKFWLVGANQWKIFVAQDPEHTVGGSGEFNQVGCDIYVKPLDKSSFKIMWDYECSHISDEKARETVKGNCDDAFISSGGVPFYAKAIGTHLVTGEQFPPYSILEGQFFELEKNLSKEERKMLHYYQMAPHEEPSSSKASVNYLKDLGLLVKDCNNHLVIPCKYLSQYIASKLADEDTAEEPTVNLLQTVDEIGELIISINHNQYQKDKSHLIPARVDAYRLYKFLRTPADTRGKFANFIDSMYVLYWDNSSHNLFEKKYFFAINSMFRKSMDRIRHIYGYAHEGETLDANEHQIDIGQALQYISGYPIEPQSAQDFLTLQISLLNHFKKDLEQINKKIKESLGKPQTK